jgi:hypothetical protein
MLAAKQLSPVCLLPGCLQLDAACQAKLDACQMTKGNCPISDIIK